MKLSTTILLNLAHLLDHHFLLIAAACASFIAADFGMQSWTEIMPYTAGAFLLFGLGSLPSGRLGDQWGRRKMMLVYFIGMGLSALLVSATQNITQFAIALVLLGLFSSIYHPVGIPMLLAQSKTPGRTVGISGLSGNVGLATAAFATALLAKYFGWRSAFVVPAIISIVMGVWFALTAESEGIAPAKRKTVLTNIPPEVARQAFWIITITSTTGSLLFNLTTNGNSELLRSKLTFVLQDPALIGLTLGAILLLASMTQLVVGQLIDKVAVKPLFQGLIALQFMAFLFAWFSSGWLFCAALLMYMVGIFGAIPFSDTLIARFVDDNMRSRVSGMRLAVSFGVSSLSVLALGPLVKAAGFGTLLLLMAGVSCLTFFTLRWLPETGRG
jgi:MFS family permease